MSEEPEEMHKPSSRPTRVKSADVGARQSRKDSVVIEKSKQKPSDKNKHSKNEVDKENIAIDTAALHPVKSKMWIRSKEIQARPRSASQAGRKPVNKRDPRKPIRKTDPVSLYQAYQKDWEKFKGNICESSHSDLRWSIREKMMGNR